MSPIVSDVGIACGLDHTIVVVEREFIVDIVGVLLFYVHGKHLRSCRDGQLT